VLPEFLTGCFGSPCTVSIAMCSCLGGLRLPQLPEPQHCTWSTASAMCMRGMASPVHASNHSALRRSSRPSYGANAVQLTPHLLEARLRSRGMAGALSAATLSAARDENGTGFREAAATAGYPSSSIQVGVTLSEPTWSVTCRALALTCLVRPPVHASCIEPECIAMLTE
jgi:hypothetical protein